MRNYQLSLLDFGSYFCGFFFRKIKLHNSNFDKTVYG